MIAILLTILKVVGILLLILLITAAALLLLVLFVPVRYRIVLRRRETDGILAAVEIKVTWLLHLMGVAFSYPEAAFLRVRIFCFTVFRSDRKKKDSGSAQKEKPDRKKQVPAKEDSERKDTDEAPSQKAEDNQEKETEIPAGAAREESHSQKEPGQEKNIFTDNGQHASANRLYVKIKEFFSKLLSLFQNIRYTITRICDKIKHIVNNIQYYLEIIKSDTFSRAWALCSGQAFSLLKSILPGKVRGSLVIGTGDPASTGQVLAVYGILYPLLGDRIRVTPDFERQIVEGELFLRGKITVFKGLKAVWKIYFNQDLRRLIQLLKREAA